MTEFIYTVELHKHTSINNIILNEKKALSSLTTPFQTILTALIYIFSPTHLPPVMTLNTPYSLPQRITAAMLMIRMGHLMFMKYDTGSHQWIFRIMYIPHMSGIPGHDGHIPVIHINNLKISRIQTLKIFSAKHLLPPFQNTLPVPSP